MRALLLTLVAALVVAGCTEAEPVTSAAEEDTEPATPADAAAEAEPATPSSPPAEEPAPSDDAAAAQANDTPEEEEAAPPAPVPQPWKLTEPVDVRYMAAVGMGGVGDPVTPPETTNCPDARFAVPEGATSLHVTLSGDTASSDPSAGIVEIVLVAPDGTEVARLNPLLVLLPAETGMQGESSFDADAPASGGWTIGSEALGPVVDQSWRLSITVSGESIDAPATLGATNACDDAAR